MPSWDKPLAVAKFFSATNFFCKEENENIKEDIVSISNSDPATYGSKKTNN